MARQGEDMKPVEDVSEHGEPSREYKSVNQGREAGPIGKGDSSDVPLASGLLADLQQMPKEMLVRVCNNLERALKIKDEENDQRNRYTDHIIQQNTDASETLAQQERIINEVTWELQDAKTELNHWRQGCKTAELEAAWAHGEIERLKEKFSSLLKEADMADTTTDRLTVINQNAMITDLKVELSNLQVKYECQKALHTSPSARTYHDIKTSMSDKSGNKSGTSHDPDIKDSEIKALKELLFERERDIKYWGKKCKMLRISNSKDQEELMKMRAKYDKLRAELNAKEEKIAQYDTNMTLSRKCGYETDLENKQVLKENKKLKASLATQATALAERNRLLEAEKEDNKRLKMIISNFEREPDTRAKERFITVEKAHNDKHNKSRQHIDVHCSHSSVTNIKKQHTDRDSRKNVGSGTKAKSSPCMKCKPANFSDDSLDQYDQSCTPITENHKVGQSDFPSEHSSSDEQEKSHPALQNTIPDRSPTKAADTMENNQLATPNSNNGVPKMLNVILNAHSRRKSGQQLPPDMFASPTKSECHTSRHDENNTA